MDTIQLTGEDDAKVTETWKVADRFARTLNGLESGVDTVADIPIEEFASYLMNRLTDTSKAHLILQMCGEGVEDNMQTRNHFAVDTASVLGPDNAQSLYRFAVLVTKLA